MLQNITKLLDFRVVNAQGDVGKVNDFYFDDATWIIRYLLVETGDWLSRNHMLIATEAFEEPDAGKSLFTLNVSRDIIRNSPDINKPLPIPAQYKNELARYRGEWPVYYTPAHEIPRRPKLSTPGMSTAVIEDEIATGQLFSVKDIAHYRVTGNGSDIGKGQDLIIDDIFWSIRYLAATTAPSESGRILLAPGMIDHIDPVRHEIVTPLRKEAIRPNATYELRNLT
jgi:hypothetical protein